MLHQRQSKREINHGIVYNDLSLDAHQKAQRTLESQIGLKLKPNPREQKKINGRAWYVANREAVIKRSVENNRKNVVKRRAWIAQHRFKIRDKLNARLREWQKLNADKVREYTRRYREKIKANMTADEIKEMHREAYQRNRANMIERYGADGWRKICNERSQKTRAKKRQKLLAQSEQ